MRITVLYGSPRREGNTRQLAVPVLNVFHMAGCETEEFFLYDMHLEGCTACRCCQQQWEDFGCPIPDDMQKIFDAVLRADVILLVTPIYSWSCPAPLKAVLDRLVYGMNKYYGKTKGPSLWAGKHLAMITTCGYPPEKGADLFEEAMKRYCRHSGLLYDGMLCGQHRGYDTVFMDEEKRRQAEAFAKRWTEILPP